MRKEIKNWWKQALEDLDTAKVNLNAKKYYAATFFCQQAVEKSLKALFILKKSESPGKTHSLIFLAKKINVPKKYFDLLQNLTPEFITTRYPDIVGETPYKLYNKEKTSNYIKESKKLLKWIKKQIKEH